MSETSTPATSTTPHTKDRVLIVADACFEMFSIQELKRPITILHEIAHSFPEASAAEITEAVGLALSWRRTLRRTRGWQH